MGSMGFSRDNLIGFILAVISSAFIGSSFIIKKKGLRRATASSGVRAGVGGYSYLMEPLWWLGMITMIVGEIANFVAYTFAPAVLVTPLGALSILVSAVLAYFVLNEKLHHLGILGCVMCIVGSIIIVIHAPQEKPISSVHAIWNMATQPAFLLYVGSVIILVFILVFYFAPQYGNSNVLVFTGICSLMGSLSVMSVKALGTALKLTFEGKNQLIYPETWFFVLVVGICVVMQLNYLNKALDTFNTAVVSPIYYVLFTSLTILASVIMYKVVIPHYLPQYQPDYVLGMGISCNIMSKMNHELLRFCQDGKKSLHEQLSFKRETTFPVELRFTGQLPIMPTRSGS